MPHRPQTPRQQPAHEAKRVRWIDDCEQPHAVPLAQERPLDRSNQVEVRPRDARILIRPLPVDEDAAEDPEVAGAAIESSAGIDDAAANRARAGDCAEGLLDERRGLAPERPLARH